MGHTDSEPLKKTSGVFQPLYGFTLDQRKGKNILIVAIITNAICVIATLILALSRNVDLRTALWAEGMTNSNPIMLIFIFQVVTGIVLIMWHSITTKGVKRALIAFFAVFLIAWFNEFLGTNFGLIFGSYHYTARNMFHILGVPAIVAPAWEVILYPSFYLSLYLLPSELIKRNDAIWSKILTSVIIAAVGAFIVTATDMLSDPWWVSFGGWVWHTNGAYMPAIDGGVPLSNYAGWFFTAFEIQLAYHFILDSTPEKRHFRSKFLDIYFPIIMYAGDFLFILELVFFFQQQFEVVLISLMSFGGIILLALVKLYLQKRGSQPNPIGLTISQEVIDSISK